MTIDCNGRMIVFRVTVLGMLLAAAIMLSGMKVFAADTIDNTGTAATESTDNTGMAATESTDNTGTAATEGTDDTGIVAADESTVYVNVNYTAKTNKYPVESVEKVCNTDKYCAFLYKNTQGNYVIEYSTTGKSFKTCDIETKIRSKFKPAADAAIEITQFEELNGKIFVIGRYERSKLPSNGEKYVYFAMMTSDFKKFKGLKLADCGNFYGDYRISNIPKLYYVGGNYVWCAEQLSTGELYIYTGEALSKLEKVTLGESIQRKFKGKYNYSTVAFVGSSVSVNAVICLYSFRVTDTDTETVRNLYRLYSKDGREWNASKYECEDAFEAVNTVASTIWLEYGENSSRLYAKPGIKKSFEANALDYRLPGACVIPVNKQHKLKYIVLLGDEKKTARVDSKGKVVCSSLPFEWKGGFIAADDVNGLVFAAPAEGDGLYVSGSGLAGFTVFKLPCEYDSILDLNVVGNYLIITSKKKSWRLSLEGIMKKL